MIASPIKEKYLKYIFIYFRKNYYCSTINWDRTTLSFQETKNIRGKLIKTGKVYQEKVEPVFSYNTNLFFTYLSFAFFFIVA